MGPSDADVAALNVGPHPHIGLQTVTWLLAGTVLHRDSLGSEQLIRPGQLNLMTAGRGVSHAEETPPGSRGTLHGLQLWVAQPDSTRFGEPAFEHHAALPEVAVGGGRATVLVGDFLGACSPARADTKLMGVDLVIAPGATTLPLDPAFEHGLTVAEGALEVAGDHQAVKPGSLAYLGAGRDELRLTSADGARALLLGGAPFGSEVLMWWNFVARTRAEVEEAYADWQAGGERFGSFASPLARIPAPRPHWVAE